MKNSAKVDGRSVGGTESDAWNYFSHDQARSRLELGLGAFGADKGKK